jgi:hypothetical protein
MATPQDLDQTVKEVASMIERGRGGAIVLTSSTAGINGMTSPTPFCGWSRTTRGT